MFGGHRRVILSIQFIPAAHVVHGSYSDTRGLETAIKQCVNFEVLERPQKFPYVKRVC